MLRLAAWSVRSVVGLAAGAVACLIAPEAYGQTQARVARIASSDLQLVHPLAPQTPPSTGGEEGDGEDEDGESGPTGRAPNPILRSTARIVDVHSNRIIAQAVAVDAAFSFGEAPPESLIPGGVAVPSVALFSRQNLDPRSIGWIAFAGGVVIEFHDLSAAPQDLRVLSWADPEFLHLMIGAVGAGGGQRVVRAVAVHRRTGQIQGQAEARGIFSEAEFELLPTAAARHRDASERRSLGTMTTLSLLDFRAAVAAGEEAALAADFVDAQRWVPREEVFVVGSAVMNSDRLVTGSDLKPAEKAPGTVACGGAVAGGQSLVDILRLGGLPGFRGTP